MFRKLSVSALVFASLLAAGCASMGSDAPAKAADGVLVGANGMTLYTFDRDSVPGKSACNGPCAIDQASGTQDDGVAVVEFGASG